MSTTTTTIPKFNFCGVYWERRRILKDNPGHYHALTALFLYPLSLSAVICSPQPNYSDIFGTSDDDDVDHRIRTLFLSLIYTLFLLVFSQCAAGTITYSSYHGLYGTPIKLTSTLKSLLQSFIPLLATAIVSQSLLILMGVAFGLFAIGTISALQFLGLEIEYGSVYFSGFCTAILMIIGVVLVYMQVNWSLASAVVVVESKWGWEALRRSGYLVRGMKWVCLWVTFLWVFVGGFYLWIAFPTVVNNGGGGGWWSWLLGLVVALVQLYIAALFLLNNMVSMTVLYVFCKATHGELAPPEEVVAGEYVRLPSADDI